MVVLLAEDDEPGRREEEGGYPDEGDDAPATAGAQVSAQRRRDGQVALDGDGHQRVDGRAHAHALQVGHQFADERAQHPG